MTKLDDRTIANIEVALEKACRVLPNGGDHESRKYIAQKLKLSAKKGNVTLGELDAIAHSAVQELSEAKFGLAAMSESDDLIRLAILSSTDALEALDNALASPNFGIGTRIHRTGQTSFTDDTNARGPSYIHR